MRSSICGLVVLLAAGTAFAAGPVPTVHRATDPAAFDDGVQRRAPKSLVYLFGEAPEEQDPETSEGGDGGSSSGGEGTGEPLPGNPDLDLASADLSGDGSFSVLSGFNAADLIDMGFAAHPPDLARRANQALAFTVPFDEPGFATAPGYGNDWDQWVTWSRPAPNPSSPVVVRVRFVVNHDLEPGRDVFRLEVSKSTGYETVVELTGANGSPTAPGPALVDETFTLLPSDFGDTVDPRVRLRLRVLTDRTGSDEDGLWPSDGAAQVDEIRVWFDGGLVSYADFEATGSGRDGWESVASDAAGDFLKVLPLLTDPDPCRRNVTVQYAFVDDGTPPSGGTVSTGGSLSSNWTYGPGGYVTNYTGGVSGGTTPLHNALRSPAFAWDVPGSLDDGRYGGVLLLSVWEHLPLENGLFWFWSVRSHSPATGWSPWRDFGEVFYESGAPHYERVEIDVTSLLVADPDSAQFELGVVDLAQALGLPGGDATPSPLFDNLAFAKYQIDGPAIRIADGDVFQSAFPTSGTADWNGDLAQHAIRLDMARDIADGAAIVPGDSMVVRVRSTIPGVALAGPPTLRWALLANPRYAAVRQLPAGATLETTVAAGCLDASPVPIHTGTVDGQAVVTSTGRTIDGLWSFDLPDGPARAPWHTAESAMFFPGDRLRWFVEAVDALGNRTTFPADTTGFFRLGPDAFESDEGDVVHGLPTLAGAVATQPPILVIDDTGQTSRGAVIESALAQIGRRPGCEVDVYRVRAAGSGLSNGIGSAAGHGANAAQLSGYEAVLVFGGDQGAYLLSDGSGDPLDDDGEDLGVLQQWRAQTGNRYGAWFGDNLVTGLTRASAAGALFVREVLGVEAVADDVRPRIDDQLAPRVEPLASGFTTAWTAGACLLTEQFDAIAPVSGTPAVRTHGYVDLQGSATGYAESAAVWHARTTASGPRIDVTVPVSFSSILDPGVGRTAGLPARAVFLQEILDAFAVGAPGPVTSGPAAADRRVQLAMPVPNPFNPRTTVSFDLPRSARVEVRVLDVAGRVVATLVDEARPAGRHDVVWNGTDDHGSAVASGVYLVQLRADGERQQRKVALIR